jgi:hypothetical protein
MRSTEPGCGHFHSGVTNKREILDFFLLCFISESLERIATKIGIFFAKLCYDKICHNFQCWVGGYPIWPVRIVSFGFS